MKEEEEREHGEIKDRREMRREEKINKVLKIAFFIYHYTIEYIQNTTHLKITLISSVKATVDSKLSCCRI